MWRPRLPPPLLGLLVAAGMYGLSALLPGLSFAFPGQDLLAVVLIVIGLGIDGVAVAAFLRARTTILPFEPERASTLVITGLYRFSRNPMYLGMLSVLAGIAVWLGNPLNIAFLGLFVVLINAWQIVPEERALQARFGESFDAYCRRVGRWL